MTATPRTLMDRLAEIAVEESRARQLLESLATERSQLLAQIDIYLEMKRGRKTPQA